MTVAQLPGALEPSPYLPVAGTALVARPDLRAAPRWLSRPAKDAWRQIVPLIAEAYPDEISVLDLPALALLCEHYAITMRAAEEMRARGNVPRITEPSEAKNGGPLVRKVPQSQVMRDHGKAFIELAREFGMTPRARAQMGRMAGPPVVPDTGEDDDLFDA